MDRKSARRVALMSIKPQYAFRLFSGEKRVEFRRRATTDKITHIVVYATRPVSAVVGILEIEDLVRGTPKALWRAFSKVGGIERADFFDYFAGTTTGVAYVVGKARSCALACELGKFGLPKVPPQAVQYLPPDITEEIKLLRRQHHLDYQAWLNRYCGIRGGDARG